MLGNPNSAATSQVVSDVAASAYVTRFDPENGDGRDIVVVFGT